MNILQLSVFLSVTITVVYSTCNLPAYMNGNWSDSKFLDVEFYNRTTMYFTRYSISRKKSSSTFTCFMSEGNKYVLKTTEIVTAEVSGVDGDYYYYLCMDVTQITEYSFFYYLQANEDTNGERTTALFSNNTVDSISVFCSVTIPLEQFHIMVRKGYENQVLQTCSTPLLRDFTFTLTTETSLCAGSYTGNWSYTGEEYSKPTIEYNEDACIIKVGHSDNSNVGCAMCVLSGDTYITSIINLDTTIDEAVNHRFTCMVSRADGNNITFSQRARICHKDQTPDTLPDDSVLNPLPGANPGAKVYLVPNGPNSSKTSNCFPRSTEDMVDDSTKSNAVVIAVVMVLLLLIIAGVVIFVYWWKKIRGRTRRKGQAPQRKGKFIFNVRMALTAGMGNSQQRQKSFIHQSATNDIKVSNQTKKTNDSSVPVENKNTKPNEDYTVHEGPMGITIITEKNKIKPENLDSSQHQSIQPVIEITDKQQDVRRKVNNNIANYDIEISENLTKQATLPGITLQRLPTQEQILKKNVSNDFPSQLRKSKEFENKNLLENEELVVLKNYADLMTDDKRKMSVSNSDKQNEKLVTEKQKPKSKENSLVKDSDIQSQVVYKKTKTEKSKNISLPNEVMQPEQQLIQKYVINGGENISTETIRAKETKCNDKKEKEHQTDKFQSSNINAATKGVDSSVVPCTNLSIDKEAAMAKTSNPSQKEVKYGENCVISDIKNVHSDIKQLPTSQLEEKIKVRTENEKKSSPDETSRAATKPKTITDKQLKAVDGYKSPVSNQSLQNQKKLKMRKQLMKTKSPLAKKTRRN